MIEDIVNKNLVRIEDDLKEYSSNILYCISRRSKKL